MGRYVPRSVWAEQKTSREAAAEKQQSITLVNQSFDERKIVVLRSDASDKTAKQNQSDDHFRLADQPSRIIARRGVIQAFPRFGKLLFLWADRQSAVG
jgi:hypothetical protein